MTPQSGEPGDLRRTAEEIASVLTLAAEHIVTNSAILNSEINRIERLTPLSESDERARTMAASRDGLELAQRSFDQFKAAAGWAGWREPVRRWKLGQALRLAQSEHDRVKAIFDSAEEHSARTARIDAHNQAMQREVDRLPTLRTSLEAQRRLNGSLSEFRAQSEHALRAAREDGWLAASFAKNFLLMAQAVRARNFPQALHHLGALIFQRRPSDQVYEALQQEAAIAVEKAYRTYNGFAAAGAYGQVARRSISMVRPALRVPALGRLDRLAHPADQWQLLAEVLGDPRMYETDALWAVYWAMFQCGQALSQSLAAADAHEDIFTGELAGYLKSGVARFTADRIQRFGYPAQRSYLGLLQNASMSEEARLGADIGVIVDIDVGSLVCRKVALLQAKKAMDGFADVGSGRSQLARLSANPQIGFYMFYHQASLPLRSPGPTVCSATELAAWATDSGHSPEAEHLRINVRERGWDWAAFMSFGLCQPESTVGAPFRDADDALRVLGGGDPAHLPRFLHVVAIADEARVQALDAAIKRHYRAMQQQRSPDMQTRSTPFPGRGTSR